jgi:hypothetical protein
MLTGVASFIATFGRYHVRDHISTDACPCDVGRSKLAARGQYHRPVASHRPPLSGPAAYKDDVAEERRLHDLAELLLVTQDVDELVAPAAGLGLEVDEDAVTVAAELLAHEWVDPGLATGCTV